MQHLLALLLPLLSPAQVTLEYDDEIEIGTLADLDSISDHATVAINDSKDIYVVWHTEFDPGTTNQFLVEGILIPYNSTTGDWTISTEDADFHHILGDHQANVFSHGTDKESCKKPDVVAVGDNFIVVWSRHDLDANPSPSRLECAFIEVTGGVITAINGETTSEYSGVGDLIDGNIEQGLAGIMPDLVALDVDIAGVVYAHETDDNTTYRDYTIRFAAMDYGTGSLDILTLQDLVEDVHLDNVGGSPGTPMVGGNITPDVVLNDDGDLIIAFSSYSGVARPGISTAAGHIWAYRFAFDAMSEPACEEIDHSSFNHSVSGAAMRRPNLAVSQSDLNKVTLTWIDTDSSNANDPYQIRVREADFSISSTYYSTNDTHATDKPDGQPVPLNLENADAIVFDREYPGGGGYTVGQREIRYRSLSSSTSGPNGSLWIDHDDENWRPALATWEDPSNPNDKDIVVLTWEGADFTTAPDNEPYKIHITVKEFD